MFNIAIDGVAGCGKSTIADKLSKRLKIKKFNTGLVYRAITCEYLSKFGEGINPNKKNIDMLVNDLNVEVVFDKGVQKVFVNGHDYNDILRDENVTMMTPLVSGYDTVREKVREIQRTFAKNNDCIMEGRDIGRVVLKDADCKLFLMATPRVRAKRRFDQIKNSREIVSFEEVLKDIEKRDKEDKKREHGAMIPADDAIIIDNSKETLKETLDRCEKIIKEKRFKKES